MLAHKAMVIRLVNSIAQSHFESTLFFSFHSAILGTSDRSMLTPLIPPMATADHFTGPFLGAILYMMILKSPLLALLLGIMQTLYKAPFSDYIFPKSQSEIRQNSC